MAEYITNPDTGEHLTFQDVKLIIDELSNVTAAQFDLEMLNEQLQDELRQAKQNQMCRMCKKRIYGGQEEQSMQVSSVLPQSSIQLEALQQQQQQIAALLMEQREMTSFLSPRSRTPNVQVSSEMVNIQITNEQNVEQSSLPRSGNGKVVTLRGRTDKFRYSTQLEIRPGNCVMQSIDGQNDGENVVVQIDKLTRKISNLRKRNDLLTAESEKVADLYSQLLEQYKDVSDKQQHAADQALYFKSMYEQEVAVQNNQLVIVRNDKRELGTQLFETKDALSTAKRQNQQLASELEKLRNQYEQGQKKLTEQESLSASKIKDMSEITTNLQNNLKNLANQIELMNADEIPVLNQQIQQLQHQNTSLQQNEQKLLKQISVLGAQATKLRQIIDEQKYTVLLIQNKKTQQQKKIAELQQYIQDIASQQQREKEILTQQHTQYIQTKEQQYKQIIKRQSEELMTQINIIKDNNAKISAGNQDKYQLNNKVIILEGQKTEVENKLKQCINDVQGKQKQLEQLQTAIFQFQHQISQKDFELRQERSKNEDLKKQQQDQKENFQNEITQSRLGKQADVLQFQSLIDKLNSDIQVMVQQQIIQTEKYEAKNQKLEQELKEHVQEVGLLQQQLIQQQSQKSQVVDQLQQQLTQEQKEKADLQSSNLQLNKKLMVLQLDVDQNQSVIQNLKQQDEFQKQQFENTEKQLQKQIQSFKNQQEQLEADLGKYKQSAQKNEDQVAFLQQQLAQYQAQFCKDNEKDQDFSLFITQKDQELRELTGKFNETKLSLASLEQTLQQQKKISAEEQQNLTKQAELQVQQFNKQLEEKQERIKNLMDSGSQTSLQIESRIAQLTTDLQVKQQQIDDLKSKVQNLEDDMEQKEIDYLREKTNLKNQLTQVSDKVKQFDQEKKYLTDNLAKDKQLLETKVKLARDEVETLEQDRKELRDSLAAQQLQYSELMQQSSKSEDTSGFQQLIDKLQKQCANQKNELERSEQLRKDQIQSLDKQLFEAQESLQLLDAELAQNVEARLFAEKKSKELQMVVDGGAQQEVNPAQAAALEERIVQLQSQQSGLATENGELEKRFAQQQEETQNGIVQIETLKIEISGLQEQLKLEKEQHEATLKEAREAPKEAVESADDKDKEVIQQLEAEKQQLTSSIAKLRDEVATQTQLASEANAQNWQLEAEVKGLKSALEAARDQGPVLDASALDAEKVQLDEALAAAIENCAEMESRVTLLQSAGGAPAPGVLDEAAAKDAAALGARLAEAISNFGEMEAAISKLQLGSTVLSSALDGSTKQDVLDEGTGKGKENSVTVKDAEALGAQLSAALSNLAELEAQVERLQKGSVAAPVGTGKGKESVTVSGGVGPADYTLDNFKSYFSVIHREPDNGVPPLEELDVSKNGILKKLRKNKFVSAKTPDFVFKLCRQAQGYFTQSMLVNNVCDEFGIEFDESLATTDHLRNFIYSKFNTPMEQYIEKALHTMINNVKLETPLGNQIPDECWDLYFDLLKVSFYYSLHGCKMNEEKAVLTEKKAVIYPGWTFPDGTVIKPMNLPREECQDLFL